MQMNSELTAYCSNFAVGLTSSIFARFTGVEKGLVYSRRLRQSDPSVALNATETLLRKYQEHLKRAKSLGWKLSPVKGAQVCTYMFLLYAAYALAF
jgi:hypothetical protein